MVEGAWAQNVPRCRLMVMRELVTAFRASTAGLLLGREDARKGNDGVEAKAKTEMKDEKMMTWAKWWPGCESLRSVGEREESILPPGKRCANLQTLCKVVLWRTLRRVAPHQEHEKRALRHNIKVHIDLQRARQCLSLLTAKQQRANDSEPTAARPTNSALRGIPADRPSASQRLIPRLLQEFLQKESFGEKRNQSPKDGEYAESRGDNIVLFVDVDFWLKTTRISALLLPLMQLKVPPKFGYLGGFRILQRGP